MYRLSVFAVLIPLVVSPIPLSAADTSRVLSPDQSGDCSKAGDWSAGEPTSTVNAYITNGGTASVTQSGETANGLYLGGGDGGTVQVNGGSITVEALYVGSGGTGLFSQFGGTTTIHGDDVYRPRVCLGNRLGRHESSLRPCDPAASFRCTHARTSIRASVDAG